MVSPRRVPTPREAGEAIDRLLATVEAGADIFDALDDIAALHPKNNTFPGEAFLALAADALDGRRSGTEQPHL
jgi:hypothetical protein